MKQNHDIESKSVNDDTTVQIFECPVCGGHDLTTIYQVYGTQQVVGTRSDGRPVLGLHEEQGIDYGVCDCPECDWRGEFYQNMEGCFAQHMVEAKRLVFTCPQCGAHDLRLFRQGHTSSHSVSAVYEKESADAIEVAIDTLDRDDDGGNFFYGCGRCQTRLLDENQLPIAKEDALITWLKNHQ